MELDLGQKLNKDYLFDYHAEITEDTSANGRPAKIETLSKNLAFAYKKL